MTEDEMVGQHHQLNRHAFEQAPRVYEGQGSLGCCSPWGHKELDTTELLNNYNEVKGESRVEGALTFVHWEKMHNLRVEKYVLFGRFSEDIAHKRTSRITLKDRSEEERGEPGYIGVFAIKQQKSPRQLEHQKITIN